MAQDRQDSFGCAPSSRAPAYPLTAAINTFWEALQTAIALLLGPDMSPAIAAAIEEWIGLASMAYDTAMLWRYVRRPLVQADAVARRLSFREKAEAEDAAERAESQPAHVWAEIEAGFITLKAFEEWLSAWKASLALAQKEARLTRSLQGEGRDE